MSHALRLTRSPPAETWPNVPCNVSASSRSPLAKRGVAVNMHNTAAGATEPSPRFCRDGGASGPTGNGGQKEPRATDLRSHPALVRRGLTKYHHEPTEISGNVLLFST